MENSVRNPGGASDGTVLMSSGCGKTQLSHTMSVVAQVRLLHAFHILQGLTEI